MVLETAAATDRGVDVRLGYLIAESAWGKGLASELIGGFVEWCREQTIVSIEGGVGRENQASQRVLEKNGFELVTPTDPMQGELFFRLVLDS